MLNTQKYIQENGLEKLISTYNLVANKSTRHPSLIQLCYHQLDTPKNEVTNECRGLILDTADNFKVVAYPFYRFSDIDDKKEEILDKESVKVYDKLDGSLITLYWYGGEWNVSTKTVPDASGKIMSKGVIFRDAFFEEFKNLGYSLPKDINLSYVFEYQCGQGIVKCQKDDINLLMVRDITTLEELNHIEIAKKLQWGFVKPLEMTLEETKEAVRWIDPLVSEGYVVCDKNGYRLKIKSPQFERISELKINWDNTEERQKMIEKDNFRKLCDIIRTNNHASFIGEEKYTSVYNQWKKIKGLYKKLLNDTQRFVDKIDGLQGKELGLVLKDKDKYLNGLAFGISQGKIDKNKDGYLEDYFYNLSIKTFEEIIKSLK